MQGWQEKEQQQLRVQSGPGVNEVSFCAWPFCNAHSTLGIGTGATALVEGGFYGKGGEVKWKDKII
jgi:hypothetical protein